MAVVHGEYAESAFAGELDAADMLAILMYTLHAGPEVEEGVHRAMSVVVKTTQPRGTGAQPQPEQLDALDCLETIGAASTVRACEALRVMLTDEGLASRTAVRKWSVEQRRQLAAGTCSDKVVSAVAEAACKRIGAPAKGWGLLE